MVKLKKAPILGMFGKGRSGSIALNFSRSGGKNCARKCRHHPRSTAPRHLQTHSCYAVVVESRPDRQNVASKLERHENLGATRVVNSAIAEISRLSSKGKLPPWLRISTGGSVPARPSAGLLSSLRSLLTICRQLGIPVHFPVETATKAQTYRAAVGHLCIVRESIQDDSVDTLGAISCTAGEAITGKNIRQRRIRAAVKKAREIREATGRKTIVCPAITSGWALKTAQSQLTGAKKRNHSGDIVRLTSEVERREIAADRSKCGQGGCEACSLDCNVVYPLH